MQPRQALVFALLLSASFRSELKAFPLSQRYDYAYQLYQEEADRIKIVSHYVKGGVELTEDTSVRFQYLKDTISGASPTGALMNSGQFLATLEDVRTGVLGAVSQKFGDHRVELEISRNKEDDYLSRGYAINDVWDLNQKNTTLNFGFNYLDDSVSVTVPGVDPLDKRTYDSYLGFTQILDKNTTFTAGVTLGYTRGFISDPYKVVQRTDIVTIPDPLDPAFPFGGTIDVPVINVYRENRPNERIRQVFQTGVTHFFEKLEAAAEGSYRFSHDDFGVNSHTFQAEWRQRLGSRFELVPFARYYTQNEADFFVNTLDGLVVGAPNPDPRGDGINYSADYRLSSFNSVGLGLRGYFKINENFRLSAAYERYTMEANGSGPNTSPTEAYPTADLFTFGVTASF